MLGAGALNGAIGNQAAEPERTQSEQAVVQKEHAPLFDHKLTIDQGLSYTYYDRRQLSLTGFLALDAIFLGNINLDQTKASQYQYDVDVRYGLAERISIDLDIPYMYRRADPNNDKLITPAKLPTGTGIWNFTAGVSVLKTYDPVVLFGSLSYTYNVATSIANISSVQGQVEPGKVKLGDIFQIGAGAAIALSDKTSASLSFTTAIEPETKTDTGSGYERPRQPDQCVHQEFWTEPGHQQASDDQRLSQHRTHPRCAGLRGRVAFPVHLLTAKRRGYRARTHSFNKRSSGCEKT